MKKITHTQIVKFLGIPASTWGMYVTGKRQMSYKLAEIIEVKTGIDTKFTMKAPKDHIILAITAYCVGRV